MTLKRLSFTSFFIFLTLSIGIVSINSPLNVNAQNSALTQSGGGTAEHEIEQGQLSTQNNQIVTGDDSILSGNNLACQDQDNSLDGLGICPDFLETVPPESGFAPLHIKTVLKADCTVRTTCPIPDGRVIIQVNGWPWEQYDPATRKPGGTTEGNIDMPIGYPYSIEAQSVNAGFYYSYEFGNIQGDCSGRDKCNAVMGPNGANVILNFHYCRNPC